MKETWRGRGRDVDFLGYTMISDDYYQTLRLLGFRRRRRQKAYDSVLKSINFENLLINTWFLMILKIQRVVVVVVTTEIIRNR